MKKTAAIVSDSMLSQLEPYQEDYIKTSLNLDTLVTQAYSGKTASFLLNDPSIQRKLERKRFDFILFSAGQNDISHSVFSNGRISDESCENIALHIMRELSPKIHSFTQKFQNSRIVFLPLTLRIPCAWKQTRFPESRNPRYIEKINKVMAHLVTQLFKLDIPNFLVIEAPKLWKKPGSHVIGDGLHLSTSGLDDYLVESLVKLKKLIE